MFQQIKKFLGFYGFRRMLLPERLYDPNPLEQFAARMQRQLAAAAGLPDPFDRLLALNDTVGEITRYKKEIDDKIGDKSAGLLLYSGFAIGILPLLAAPLNVMLGLGLAGGAVLLAAAVPMVPMLWGWNYLMKNNLLEKGMSGLLSGHMTNLDLVVEQARSSAAKLEENLAADPRSKILSGFTVPTVAEVELTDDAKPAYNELRQFLKRNFMLEQAYIPVRMKSDYLQYAFNQNARATSWQTEVDSRLREDYAANKRQLDDLSEGWKKLAGDIETFQKTRSAVIFKNDDNYALINIYNQVSAYIYPIYSRINKISDTRLNLAAKAPLQFHERKN